MDKHKLKDYTERLKKETNDNAHKMLYMWIKQDVISLNEYQQLVLNLSLQIVMPCTTFEHTAVDLKDGSTAVWTDGLSLNSDNDRHCQYKLEGGKKYRVVLYEA